MFKFFNPSVKNSVKGVATGVTLLTTWTTSWAGVELLLRAKGYIKPDQEVYYVPAQYQYMNYLNQEKKPPNSSL